MIELHKPLWLLAAATALLAGCENPAPEPDASAKTAEAAAVVAPFSINEMMVMIVDQPGEQLWDVEKGHEPADNEDWYQLEHHAVALAAAATLIKLGGTGPMDAEWAADPVWQSSSDQLVAAAQLARGATRAKDLEALIAANGAIVDACEACHAKFKPDIPTGGLFMHQRPGFY